MDNKSRSATTRQSLLNVGMEMARETGLRGLTVRGLAARAGVNPGSFVYHFGARDAFLAQLIETWYQPMFAQLQLQHSEAVSSRQRLRSMLLQLVTFLREHRHFVVHLLQDVAAGEAAALAFVATLGARHPRLLLQVVQAAQEEGELEVADPLQQLVFLAASLAAPIILTVMLGQVPQLPPGWPQVEQQLALDLGAITQRLDWALRGISPVAAGQTLA